VIISIYGDSCLSQSFQQTGIYFGLIQLPMAMQYIKVDGGVFTRLRPAKCGSRHASLPDGIKQGGGANSLIPCLGGRMMEYSGFAVGYLISHNPVLSGRNTRDQCCMR